jgi:hypothetical protein
LKQRIFFIFSLFSLFLIISLIFSNNTQSYSGVSWDTHSGQNIKPGETLIVNTTVYNSNRYEVIVSLSIWKNYTIIPENESYTTLSPSPNGTWYAELNLTEFILGPKELIIVPLIIIAPSNAVNEEAYGMYFKMYVENFYFSNLNDNETYVFSAQINFNEQTNNTNGDKIINNNIPNTQNPENIIKTNDTEGSNLLKYEITLFAIIIIIFIAIFVRLRR